jgi:UDPglucose 6-dehydrogenase
MTKISVIGTGYVGITTAACFSYLGLQVSCFDSNPERLSELRSGKLPIYEPGLQELIDQGRKSERLEFSYGLAECTANADFIFVCVSTPSLEDGSADLSNVLSVLESLAASGTTGGIVVIKSSVPIGATRSLLEGYSLGALRVAVNPEFLREGSAVNDFLHPDRIVVGANEEETRREVAELYSSLKAPQILTSFESAEMIKYASNAFLAMRLSFVNELSQFCEVAHADIDDVTLGMGLDIRIGQHFLKTGPGWGGSCFPKDTRALVATAADLGAPMSLVEQTINSNFRATARVVEVAKELLQRELGASVIAVWGATFKANTDDLRDSPSLVVIDSLIELGAKIQLYDPAAVVPERSSLIQCADAVEATLGADLLIIMTEWTEFGEIDPKEISSKMKSLNVLDTRRILPKNKWLGVVNTLKVFGG